MLYAPGTSRNNMPLDIREHPTWVPTVHTLEVVADLREFDRKELAPERSASNAWRPDLTSTARAACVTSTRLKERL